MARRTILHHWVGTSRRFLRNAFRALTEYRNGFAVLGALARGSAPATGVLRDGTEITAPEIRTLLATVHEVVRDRAYTPAELPIGPADVVVDIGAHVGTFTLHAARATAGAVHAYEPMPENVALLRRNVERNGAANVSVHQAAVGDREGSCRMRRGEYSVGGALAAIGGAAGAELEVPMVTLAAILRENRLERIDFLKVDCEGAEGAFLSAGAELLPKVGKIAVEYHDGWSELDHEELAELLRGAGFRVRVRPDRDPRFGYLYGVRA